MGPMQNTWKIMRGESVNELDGMFTEWMEWCDFAFRVPRAEISIK